MVDRSPPLTLPLWGWSIVALSVGLFLLFATLLEQWVDRHENSDADNFNLARLENTSGSIVMIGSSLIHDAFYHDRVMSDRLKNIDAPVIRITKNNAHQKSYEPVLPIIAHAHPRLVFIEADMLLIDRYHFHTLQLKVLHVASWLRRKLKFFGGGLPPSFEGNFEDTSTCAKMTQEAINKLAANDLIQRQFTVLKQPITPAWHRFITDIKAAGGAVIFLDIGRSPAANQALTESFVKDYTKALTAAETAYAIEIWRFPGPFEQQNYCDAAHLNARGRAVFVDWFITKLTEVSSD